MAKNNIHVSNSRARVINYELLLLLNYEANTIKQIGVKIVPCINFVANSKISP
jgi:hypothetical protein